MKQNMGGADKAIRVFIALVVSILYFTDIVSGTLGIALMVLSAVLVLTSLIVVCPLYTPFGIRTCKRKDA